MRDLSCFGSESFDIIWHPYSLTFVPDSRVVFREVSRIIKDGGIYYLSRIINGLIGEGFLLSHFSEVKSSNSESLPGSWEHFTNIAPPWVEFVWNFYPKTFDK